MDVKDEIGFKKKVEQNRCGKDDDSGHDFVGDVVGNIGVNGMDGFEQEVGQFTLANAKIILVHNPGECELINKHKYDVISGKISR